MLVNGLIIFLDGIPFIHRNDHAFTLLMGNSGDFGILLGNSLRSIDHNNDHICPLHCSNCTDHTVTFNLLFYLTLTAKSGSINKDIILSLPLHSGIYRISGSTGNI